MQAGREKLLFPLVPLYPAIPHNDYSSEPRMLMSQCSPGNGLGLFRVEKASAFPSSFLFAMPHIRV